MIYLYNELLYRPLLNLLIIIYNNVLSDLGVAIILLTLLIRFILLPLFYKSAKDQTIIQKHVAPKIKKIQKELKDNKEQQVKEIMAVYKEHQVSPFSGFLLIIIQLPILIALYRVFLNNFSNGVSEQLYSFVSKPDFIHTTFLGIINLSSRNMWLVLFAALFQYLQSRLLFTINSSKKKEKNSEVGGSAAIMEKMTKNMVYLGPAFTLIILLQFPSAVALYWMTTSAFSVIQQVIINKQLEKNARIKENIGTTNIPDGV